MEKFISYEDNRRFVTATFDSNPIHYHIDEGGVEEPIVSGFLLENIVTSYAGLEPPFRICTRFRKPLPVNSSIGLFREDGLVTGKYLDEVVMASSVKEPVFGSGKELIASLPAGLDGYEPTALYPVCFSSFALLNLGIEAPEGKSYIYSSHDISVYSDFEGGTLSLYLDKLRTSSRGAIASIAIKENEEDIAYVKMNLVIG